MTAPSSNVLKAIIRSLAPFVYSGAASAIAHFGYHVSLATTIQIVAIVGALLTIVLHALETQFPWVGVLLGYLGAPVYPPSTKALLAAQVQSLESQLATLLAQNPATPAGANSIPPAVAPPA